jgi:hypothetical protein
VKLAVALEMEPHEFVKVICESMEDYKVSKDDEDESTT